ncbi:MAG: hypothetical protein CMK32_10990 [Porticoccaceae bacterium]|nr:hypothetical protein [Porticoccaceae bacterium]
MIPLSKQGTKNFPYRALFLSLALATSDFVQAQAVTVLNNSRDGRDCYFNARQASQRPDMGSTVSEAPCTRALDSPDHQRDQAALLVNRGIILTAQQQYQAAFDDYKQALELKPNLPEALLCLGNLYFMAERFDKALALYDQSLANGLRQDSAAFINRGMVFERQGKLAEAEVEYRRALEKRPDWTIAQQKLATLLQKRSKSPTQTD